MNTSKIALHGFFLLALIVSLTIRYQQITEHDRTIRNYDAKSAILEVIQFAGIRRVDNPVLPPKMLSEIIYLKQPGCQYPYLVMPFNILGNPMVVLDKAEKTEHSRQFFYFGESWSDSQDRTKTLLLWVKNSVLSNLGGAPYIPIKTALVTSTPIECAKISHLDWEIIWKKRR